jgi:hypothetical protein
VIAAAAAATESAVTSLVRALIVISLSSIPLDVYLSDTRVIMPRLCPPRQGPERRREACAYNT